MLGAPLVSPPNQPTIQHIEELTKEKIIDDSARPNDEHEKLAKEPAEIIDDSLRRELRREAPSMQAQFLNAARKSVPSAVEAATILGGTHRWVSRISFGGADESTEPQAAVAEDYTRRDKPLGEGLSGTVYYGSRLNAAGTFQQVAIKKLNKKEEKDGYDKKEEMKAECRLHQFAHELSKPATSSLGCARLEVRARHCVMVPHMHSYKEGTAIMQFVQGTTLEKYIRGPGYDEDSAASKTSLLRHTSVPYAMWWSKRYARCCCSAEAQRSLTAISTTAT